MFYLSDNSAGRLKAHTATSRAGKHILKIEVEYDRAMDMALSVEGLEEIAAAQKAASAKPRTAGKSRSGQRKIGHTKTLALPAPDGDQ